MNIHTLVQDMYAYLKTDGWMTDELAKDLGQSVSTRLLESQSKTQNTPTLRLSQMGPRCPKALWHSIHTPELAEPLPPWATFKYSYGHIIEALAIAVAKRSGHCVVGEQDELYLDGIRGHRDCVIDGCVVDVKSCSSQQFAKYKDGTIRESDSFGYLDQLDGYVCASADDDLVTDKQHGYILAIDKTLGKVCLYEHLCRKESIRTRIEECKKVVSRSTAPDCTCRVIPDGKSGNLRLDVKASYNSYKYCCHPKLRTFLYSDGPHYLTRVVRRPDVTEIDKHGQIVYNV